MNALAVMALETGKTRLEAMGEVQETANLLRYYADVFEASDGCEDAARGIGDATTGIRTGLQPFGVFAVSAPLGSLRSGR